MIEKVYDHHRFTVHTAQAARTFNLSITRCMHDELFIVVAKNWQTLSHLHKTNRDTLNRFVTKFNWI